MNSWISHNIRHTVIPFDVIFFYSGETKQSLPSHTLAVTWGNMRGSFLPPLDKLCLAWQHKGKGKSVLKLRNYKCGNLFKHLIQQQYFNNQSNPGNESF